MENNKQLNLWDEKNLIKQKNNYENKNACVTNDIIHVTKKSSTENVSKDTISKSGIYKIINKINKKYYVGSTSNFKKRWAEHKRKLKSNKHVNDHLQSAWNKYGEHAFDFTIVETDVADLMKVEQTYLDIAIQEQSNCYNLKFCSSGGLLSEYSKQKLQGANHPLYGKSVTEERREKIRKSINKYYEENPNRIRKKPTYSNSFKQKLSNILKERLKDRSKIVNFDHKIYTFINDNTSEKFTGVRKDFRDKYKLNPSALTCIIKGKVRKGWKLVN